MQVQELLQKCSYCNLWELLIEDLDKGKAQGCMQCAVLSTFLQLDSIIQWNYRPSDTASVLWHPEVEMRIRSSHKFCDSWALYALNNQMRPWANFPTKSTLMDFDPSSTASFEFFEHRLTDCLVNHPKCRVTHPANPTRLLRLIDDTRIELVELGKSNIVKYLALSYCWGQDQPLKLRSTNKQQLERGFPISNLPVVFRDTIHIANKLRVSYLWIDSLCIIQDSISDWRVESAAMAQVYRNAYLTVAASSSAATTDSYLRRNPEKASGFFKPICFPVRDVHGSDITLVAVPDNKTSRHQWPWVAPIPDPLTTRGWTLQERLLSTRTISFGSGELEWACGTLTACECGTETAPETDGGPGLNISAHTINDREEALMFWYSQLGNYSRRALSYGRDKLLAISGVARALAPTIVSRYLAGLWEDDLHRGLAWRPQTGPLSSDHTFPDTYRAPSWSWASVDGSILYEQPRGLISTLKAYEGNITQTENDPYGEICAGDLMLQAIIFPVTLCRHASGIDWRLKTSQSNSVRDFSKVSLHGWIDGWLDIFTVASPGEERRIPRRSPGSCSTRKLIDCLPEGLEIEAFAMPIGFLPTVMSPDPTAWSPGLYKALVLTESLRRPGCYERIGFLEFYPEPGDFIDHAGRMSPPLPWADYDYMTVTII